MLDLLGPAQRCLDFFVAHWGERGWDLPARRYIAPGATLDVADDAEQLVVSLSSAAPGPGTRGGQVARGVGAQASPQVTYAVRLIRCTHVTDAAVPDAAVLHAEGVRLLTDAGRMLDTLVRWRMAEPLAVSLNALTEVGGLEPAGPDGGVVGHQASFVIHQFATIDD